MIFYRISCSTRNIFLAGRLGGRDPNTIQIIVDNALSELRAMMASADQKLLQQSDHE